MELKFKEVDTNVFTRKIYYGAKHEDFILIKPYLTISEIQVIVDMMLGTNNEVERLIIENAKIVEYCTNIDVGAYSEEKDTIAGDVIYDVLAEHGLSEIKYNVDNYTHVDNVVYRQESVYKALNTIGENLGKTVDGANINLDDIKEQFITLGNSIGALEKK